MAYQELADLTEKYKMDIAFKMAQVGIERKITAVANVTPAQLAPRVLPSVESAIGYLRSSNPSEYRTHIHQTTTRHIQNGGSAQSLYLYAGIMVEVIVALLEAELPGPENTATRQRYQRRLQGLQTLTQTTILSAQAAYNNSNKELHNSSI